MLKYFSFIFFVIYCFSIFSQQDVTLKRGAQLTFIVNTGSHQESFGLRVNVYAQINYIQLNAGSSFLYYPFSIGKRNRFIENKNSIGVVCFFGKKNQFVDWQFNSLNKQSKQDYAISYASIWYRDNAGTSQRSGAFGLQIKRITISHENDAFAGIAKDRFRTGILKIHWNDSLFKVGGGMSIWTGETTGVPKQYKPDIYPNYFKNISTLPFGKTSHGIVYGEVELRCYNNQTMGLQIGMDGEEIRHVLQNKIFHDLPFLPKKYQHQTPHYPRLNENGLPVFTKYEARKDRFYYSVGFNDY